jgi:hypothetical protein
MDRKCFLANDAMVVSVALNAALQEPAAWGTFLKAEVATFQAIVG